MVTSVFRRAREHLTVGVIQHTTERSRDDLFAELRVGTGESHVRHLEKHAGHQVDALQELEVDVHVEWKLPLPVELLLFRGKSAVLVLTLHTLCEKLLDTAGTKDLLQGSLRLADEAETKSAQTELHNHAVVQDLGCGISHLDRVLQMAHEQHVACDVVVVVQGVVVDVAEHGTSTRSLGRKARGLVEVYAQSADKRRRAAVLGNLLSRGEERRLLVGLDLGVGRLQSLDDDVCLRVDVFEPAHNDTAQSLGLLGLLKVDLRPNDGLVHLLLVAQTLHILSRVRVDVLQALGELVIETVDKADDATAHQDDRALAVLVGLAVDAVVVVLGLFLYDVRRVFGKCPQQLVNLLPGRLPHVDSHVSIHRLVVVETSRDEREQDTDLLVWCGGHFQELAKDENLLRSVGALRDGLRGRVSAMNNRCDLQPSFAKTHLATSCLQNTGQVLEQTLACEHHRLATLAHRLEVIIFLIFTRVSNSSRLLLLLGLGSSVRGRCGSSSSSCLSLKGLGVL